MGLGRKENSTRKGIRRHAGRKIDKWGFVAVSALHAGLFLVFIWGGWVTQTHMSTVDRWKEATASAHSYGQHHEVVRIFETPVHLIARSDADFYRGLRNLNDETLLLVADSYLHLEQEHDARRIYVHVAGFSEGEYRTRCQEAGTCDDLAILQSMAQLKAGDKGFASWEVILLVTLIIVLIILLGALSTMAVRSWLSAWHHWMPIGAFRVQEKRIQEIDDLYGGSNDFDVVRAYDVVNAYERPFNVPLAPRLDWVTEKSPFFMISPETLLKVGHSYDQVGNRDTAVALYRKVLDWNDDQYAAFCEKVADCDDLTALRGMAQIDSERA